MFQNYSPSLSRKPPKESQSSRPEGTTESRSSSLTFFVSQRGLLSGSMSHSASLFTWAESSAHKALKAAERGFF